MTSRLISVSALSFAGLVLLAAALAVQATAPIDALQLAGPAVPGEPVSFSATVTPNSTVRIVVIPGALAALHAVPSAQVASLGCYLGTPTALGTADATADASGNVAPVMVWASATPGSYTALLLQGSCASVLGGGRSMAATTDQVIVAQDGFGVADPVPALSAWGLAALGLALSAAGWAFLSRTRA